MHISWLQFPGVVRRSLFCGLSVSTCRCVILGFQFAAAMLHVVKLSFFVVGSAAHIGRIVVVLVALGVCRGFWLVGFFCV